MCGVKVNDRLRSGDEVDVVSGRRKIRVAEVACGNLERAIEGEAEAPAARTRFGQLEPPDVGPTAILLGPDVSGGKIGDGRLPPPNPGSAFSIRIGLVRPAPEPRHVFNGDERLEHDPDPGEIGQAVGHDDAFADLDAPVVERA